MNKIDLCLQIAVLAHQGQLDKNGEPYILHPLAVGLMGHTDEERMVGFLHDVVEDTTWTFEQLLEAGVPTGVVNAIRLLTHESGDMTEKEALLSYNLYIQQIIESGNPVALQVKCYDLRHNLSKSASDEWFLRKYKPALERVEKELERRSRVRLYVPDEKSAVAIFACGCFWGVQQQFARQVGVLFTSVGYTGGEEAYPCYEDVRAQKTGHVEAVVVEYDPVQTDYKQLCRFFFEIHDPAQIDGQGSDIGTQYRSCIYYKDRQQRETAEEVMADLRTRGYKVNTQLLPATGFWLAEDYHQDYYNKTGGEPYCHIRVRKF